MSGIAPLHQGIGTNYWQLYKAHDVPGHKPVPHGPQGPDRADIQFPGGLKNLADQGGKTLKQMSTEELIEVGRAWVAKYDGDGDGNISYIEALDNNMNWNAYKYLDGDKDGQVNFKDEFLPKFFDFMNDKSWITPKQHADAMKQLNGNMGAFQGTADLFKKFDLDGDGNLTLEEAKGYDENIESVFNDYDANGDGKINYLDEFLPKLAKDLHGMGVLNDQEYRESMKMINKGRIEGIDPLTGEQIRPRAAERVHEMVKNKMEGPIKHHLAQHQEAIRDRVEHRMEAQDVHRPKEVLDEIQRLLKEKLQHKIHPNLLRAIRSYQS